MTSNPTIFAKAIESGSDYDEQFGALLGSHTVEEAYWELVVTDIRDALAILRPVHDASDGVDGFVSLEVAPGARPRHRRHHHRGAPLPRARGRAQPVREDPRPPPRACLPSGP